MNLLELNTSLINLVVPDLEITLIIFAGNVVAADGSVTTSYTTINGLMAQVRMEHTQKLIHKNYFNASKIYKKFYIESSILSGLDRNIGTGGDYIIINNSGLYYKVVEVGENFETGWIMVIGCESTSEIEGA